MTRIDLKHITYQFLPNDSILLFLKTLPRSGSFQSENDLIKRKIVKEKLKKSPPKTSSTQYICKKIQITMKIIRVIYGVNKCNGTLVMLMNIR